MAGSPVWKVYNGSNEYQGCVHDVTLAAALVSLLGKGSTIRHGHRTILWREGSEELEAGESYDRVVEIVYDRLDEMKRKAYGR